MLIFCHVYFSIVCVSLLWKRNVEYLLFRACWGFILGTVVFFVRFVGALSCIKTCCDVGLLSSNLSPS